MIRTRPCCNGISGWSETFQGMLDSWSKAGQQILLNLNQPLQLETSASGTRVYQTGPGTPGAVLPGQGSTVEGVTRQGSIGIGFIALAVLLVYLISRKED